MGIDRTGATREDGIGKGLRQGGDGVVLGREVGLGLDLHDGGRVAVDGDRDGALIVVTVGAGIGLCETLLAEGLLGRFHVAIGSLEGFLGVHHAGAGGVAEGLHVLGGEAHVGVP